MTSDRRRFLQVAGAAVTLPSILQMAWPLLTASDAVAQTNYPNKPIQMLVGFAAGGPADIVARLVGEELSKGLGRPVVIDNVAGAGGNLATDRAAKSAPDGYTLLMATPGPIVVNPILYQKLPFDPIKDLAPISELCFQPNVLVTNTDVPAKNVRELVQIARVEPGKLTFASGGVGTTQHLAGELFKFMAQIDIRHVPYRGIATALPDILAGRVTMAFAAPSVVLHLVQEGNLRALAVASLKRSPSAPDLPTVSESGFPGFDATAWFGLMAPMGTPEPIINKLYRETTRVIALPDLRKKFDELGIEAIGNSPEEFAAAIRAETLRWAKLIKDSGMSLKD
jgi:tripartite-type tricarboxylate transporter receptor subunit TctC